MIKAMLFYPHPGSTESMFVPPTGRFHVTVKYSVSSSDHPFTDSDDGSLLNLMYLWRKFVMK